MKCSKCGEPLVKERGGALTLRAAILILPEAGGAVQARCPRSHCDGLTEIASLTWTAPPAPEPAPRRPRGVLRLIVPRSP